jgi:AcrR family transcriptional regulator
MEVAQPEQAHAVRRGDTRERIQQIALELFAEQGYERTSLREIAERLGVTKAALYYHFKSKEDIVRSFTEDYFARIDAIISWGKEQPRSAQTAQELFDRYLTVLLDGGEVFRFLQRNQAALHAANDGAKYRFAEFMPRLNAMLEIIVGQDAPARTRVRAASAFFAISTCCHFFAKEVHDGAPPAGLAEPLERDELRAIFLELASDLTLD